MSNISHRHDPATQRVGIPLAHDVLQEPDRHHEAQIAHLGPHRALRRHRRRDNPHVVEIWFIRRYIRHRHPFRLRHHDDALPILHNNKQ